MHWSDKYVGTPYIVGLYDCGDHTQNVLNNEFNRQIYFPARWDDSLDVLTEQLEDEKDYYANQISIEKAFDGDVLLMGSTSGNIHHIGILFRIGNVLYVSHNVKSIGSVVVNKVKDLKLYGFFPKEVWRTK